MRNKLKLGLIASFFALSSSFLWLPKTFAATGVIYISPSSISELNGANFSVSLRINPGTSVNAVQATVSYDPSLLQYNSTSIGAFSTCTQNSGGGGSVSVACAMLGSSTSSDSLIANINFTARSGSGNAFLQISNANAASLGGYTNPSVSNGVINLTTPVVVQAPPPTTTTTSSGSSGHGTSSSSPSTTSSNSQSTTATPTTTPTVSSPPPTSTLPIPKLSKVTSAPQFSVGDIKLHSSEPIQAYVKYGTSKLNLNLTSPTFSTDKSNNLVIKGLNLTPGTKYYYQVYELNNNSVVGNSAVDSFTSKGYTLKVALLDAHYKLLPNQVVTLHTQAITTKTNAQGVAVFENIAPGLHHLTYTVGSTSYTQPVYVTDSHTSSSSLQTAQTQSAAVVLSGFAAAPASFYSSALFITVLLVLLICATLVGLFGMTFDRHFETEKHAWSLLKHLKPTHNALMK